MTPEKEELRARVWSLATLLEREPGLARALNSPVGTELLRDAPTSPWRVVLPGAA